MKRKPRAHKQPEWMTASAYSIVGLLLSIARQAKLVLKIALKLVTAARVREQSAA